MSEEIYSRAVLYLGNQMMRPLDDDDAISLMGHEVDVRMGGVAAASGTITSARVIDDGRRLEVVVENHGRSCRACGTVVSEGQAAAALTLLRDVYATTAAAADNEMYQAVPPWAAVCSDPVACRRRCAATPPVG